MKASYNFSSASEYYRCDWRSFADKELTARPKILVTAVINSHTVRTSSGIDYNLRQILGDQLEPAERVEVRSFQPMLCPVCHQQSPYESQSDQCIFCVGRLTIDATEPSPKEFSKIADQDATIRRLANGDAEGGSISNLPVPLIAVGARLYGQAHRRRNTVPKEELPSRNVLYRIALAFIYSRVDFLRQGVSLNRVVLTDKLYGNYQSLQAVPFKRWEMWMASAFSTCSHSKKLLIRVQKGIFVPADDDQVEPSTR